MTLPIGANTHPTDIVETLASLSITKNAQECFELAQQCTNPEERAHFYQLAADQGLMPAQVAIANCFLKGDGVAQDLKQAATYFGYVANAGVNSEETKLLQQDAQLALGKLMHDSNPREALETITGLADNGHVPSLKYLADLYGEPIGYVYLKRAADLKDPEALYQLAERTLSGKGCNKNESAGWEYMRSAARAENQQAQARINAEDKKLQDLLRSLSINDHPETYFQIARMYGIGIGSISISNTKSLRYLGIAAAKDHPKSCYVLGVRYSDPETPGCELGKAYRYFKQAEQLNYPGAAQKCKEYEDYFLNTKMRADQNDIDAKIEVAELYAKGIGTSKNVNEAAKYFVQASELDREKASPRAEKLLNAWAAELLQLKQNITHTEAKFAYTTLSRAYDTLKQAARDHMSLN